MMSTATYRKIGLATLIMMASIFLSRVLGVLRESTIAAMGGAGTSVDAYKAAFVLPEILNHMVAGGFLSITFIPIFARYLAAGDEAGGRRVFSVIMTVFGAILGVLILIAMVSAPQLMAILAPGRKDPEFLTLAVRMTRIVLPAQLFFFGGGLFMAVQFAKERFLIPALAGLIYNIGIIAGGLALAPWIGIEGFSWGALIGAGVGNFGLQWIGAHKAGLRFSLRWEISHPDLRRYVALTLPLMLGLTMTFSTEIFSKFFGSFLPPGGISWIDYAWRIIMMLVGFFGQAVGMASYPYLAKMAAEQRLAEMNRLFNTSLRYLALMIPVCLLVWVVRHEIVMVLFERHQFTAADTQMTALALTGMLIGAVAVAAQTVINRGFYATQNTLLPAVYGTLTTVLSLPLYWAGVRLLGVAGIGTAISLSAIFQVLVLFVVWNRKSNNSESRGVYRFYARVTLISLPLGGLLWSVRQGLAHWFQSPSFVASLGMIVAETALFLALAGVATWYFHIEEIRTVAVQVIYKARRIYHSKHHGEE